MIYRCIAPDWLKDENPSLSKVREGEFSQDELDELNVLGYNIYFLPNYPSEYKKGIPVDGSHIDRFEFVFVDMDLKDKTYANKEEFLAVINSAGIEPTQIIDSGNGVHVYWRVTDLDAMSFLRLQRRLTRRFKTDEAVSKIYQLMRVPESLNTKNREDFKVCHSVYYNDVSYTCEKLDQLLPIITRADEEYCTQHFNRTYKLDKKEITVIEQIPLKFTQLIKNNAEAKELWVGDQEDRSASDFRLGHLMFANGFTKEEATSVLVNCAKALTRAPAHRINYAVNIVDKIWIHEMTEDKSSLDLSRSVRDILNRAGDTLKGTRFPCWRYLDDTQHGFRLGQIIGLVAGSGVGKTAMALNMFEGFVESNPDYDHFFVPLEQPVNEIADRWRTMCGDKVHLHDKVHVISNYADDGSYRHLSFGEIKDYLLSFQKKTGRKVGCVVIDHIGVLKKKGQKGENQDLMNICSEMKAFATETNTLLIMQSQTSREKAGIGDLELDKDAAYGTVMFESFCDYLITIWQPLKRCYSEPGCPAVTAFKFCKIRHKKKGVDKREEDVPYVLVFDPLSEHLREPTQKEEQAIAFWNQKATSKRKADRKTDVVKYQSTKTLREIENGKTGSNQDTSGATTLKNVSSG